MSETPISPLRRRMIEDMSLRNFGEKTRTTTSVTLRLSQRSLATRPPARRAKTFAAIKCIKAGLVSHRRPLTPQSLRCGSSSG
jgi:hypothetical protein